MLDDRTASEQLKKVRATLCELRRVSRGSEPVGRRGWREAPIVNADPIPVNLVGDDAQPDRDQDKARRVDIQDEQQRFSGGTRAIRPQTLGQPAPQRPQERHLKGRQRIVVNAEPGAIVHPRNGTRWPARHGVAGSPTAMDPW